MRRWLNEHCELWPYKALFATLLIGALGLLASLFGREVLVFLLVLPAPGAVWLFVRRWNQRAERLRHLGTFRAVYGDYTGAESLFRQALAIDEKTFGEDHREVATDLDWLAWLYDVQGKTAEAVPLHTRALGIWEKTLGPDHPFVACSLNHLAAIYHRQDKNGEAESLYLRSIAAGEKIDALDPGAPVVAIALSNLALLYEDEGNYAPAATLYKRALAIREKALGLDHPDVASVLEHMAMLYNKTGRVDEAN